MRALSVSTPALGIGDDGRENSHTPNEAAACALTRKRDAIELARRMLAGALVTAAIISMTAVAGSAQTQKIYWAHPSIGGVARVNTDGSSYTEGVSIEGARHLAIDELHGVFYVTNPVGIKRGSLDSRIVKDVIVDANLGLPWGVALDAAAGVLYFGDYISGSLRRINVDGTGLATIPGINTAHFGVALDPAAQQIYFGDGSISRANVDGTNVTTVVESGAGWPIWQIVVDAAGGTIYWVSGTGVSDGKIMRVNLDGSNATELLTGIDPSFGGLAVDSAGGKLYWFEYLPDPGGGYAAIRRANLDGSNPEEIVRTSHAGGLALCDNCPRMSPCPQTPAACTPSASQKAAFALTDTAFDDKDQIKWKGSGGADVTQADLGYPNTTTTYAACIYDSTAGVDALVGSLQIEPNPMWIDNDPKGWSYKEKTGSADGVVKARLKPGADGKPKAQVVAKGGNIPMPTPFSDTKLFNQDPRVVVQLVTDPINNPTSTCWGSEFSSALVNDGTQFKAKAP